MSIGKTIRTYRNLELNASLSASTTWISCQTSYSTSLRTTRIYRPSNPSGAPWRVLAFHFEGTRRAMTMEARRDRSECHFPRCCRSQWEWNDQNLKDPRRLSWSEPSAGCGPAQQKVRNTPSAHKRLATHLARRRRRSGRYEGDSRFGGDIRLVKN